MNSAVSYSDIPRVLTVKDLVRYFQKPRRHPFQKRKVIRALDGVDFYIRPGETLGLVGESGCGKSTTGRLVIGIDRPTRGSVVYEGLDLAGLSKEQLRDLRQDIQMIFQNPIGALDPRIEIGRQIREPLDIFNVGEAGERETALLKMLDAVGLAPEMRARYTHELSGGQAQRAVIARALIIEPRLLVCDEPVSALDVSVQAQVVELLAGLQEKLGLSYLFISHDLKVVKRLSHRMAVMYLGRIVEQGLCGDVFRNPAHPYTQALISAIPRMEPGAPKERIILEGDPPSPVDPPDGCPFHTRCPRAWERCAQVAPETALSE